MGTTIQSQPTDATIDVKHAQAGNNFAGQGDKFSTVQSNSIPPTADIYGRLQYAYGYFNVNLFGGQLPNSVLTLTRQRNTIGYFGAEFFASTDTALAHEISLNPAYFEVRGDPVTLSTLVHEQAHLARHEYGPANRAGGRGSRGYHDKPWAELMLSVGLHPTDDGTWNGKMTGYRMTHLVIEGGPFDRACTALLDSGFEIRWRDHRRTVGVGGGGGEGNGPASGGADAKRPKPTRAKYTCPSCKQNAWAKHAARLVCGVCSRPLVRT